MLSFLPHQAVVKFQSEWDIMSCFGKTSVHVYTQANDETIQYDKVQYNMIQFCTIQ